MEKYVRQQIEAQGLSPILDKSWKKILGKVISAPDFTIVQDDATVFIEVKRKHLPEVPKVLQTNDAFACHLDDSVVKGVVEMYSLASEVMKTRPDCIKNFDGFYGVVVTYKNDYLRGGQQFWDEFLREEVAEQLDNLSIDPNMIQPENIFLLPIDDMDYLLAFLKENPESTLGAVFEQVKEYEADPACSSFFFHDHLSRIAGGQTPRPEYLWDKISVVIDEITDKMLENEEGSILAQRTLNRVQKRV